MRSSWQSKTGHLVCSWSKVDRRIPYNPIWMQDNPNAQGSYLPPTPDFASHSPFVGASWFQRSSSARDSASAAESN